jgi:hypothetical protein
MTMYPENGMTSMPITSTDKPTDDNKSKRRTRADDKFDRYAWRDAVFADPKTSLVVKVLAFGIAQHVNGATGEARVGTETLAADCGMSDKWVRNNIPELHNSGWVVVEFGSKGRGRKHCNVYRINPEKRTQCTVLAVLKKRTLRPVLEDHAVDLERTGKPDFSTLKPDFSTIKPDTVSDEPLNLLTPLNTEYVERGSVTERGTTTSVDAPLNPTLTTVDDAPVSTSETPVLRALARTGRVEAQPQTPSATSLGTAANGADVNASPAVATLVDTEAEFQNLRGLIPNRDDEAGSRLAYFAVLRESADVHQTVGLLRYGARRYAKFVSERLASGGRVKIRTVAEFLESGLWRPENASDAIARAAAGHAGLDQHKQVSPARSTGRQ